MQRDGNKYFGGVAKSLKRKASVRAEGHRVLVISRITKFIMEREAGRSLIITHAALQMIEHWACKLGTAPRGDEV